MKNPLKRLESDAVPPKQKILDLTAGNRSMWKDKDNPQVLFTDIEPELEIKPDMVVDFRNTPFQDKQFNLIFFDPPHGWRSKRSKTICSHGFKNCKERDDFISKHGHSILGCPPGRSAPGYYGWDKFATKYELLRAIYLASEEIHRILADDGVLMFKWNECEIPLSSVLQYMNDFKTVIKLQLSSNINPMGSAKTYWLLMMKKEKQERPTLSR